MNQANILTLFLYNIVIYNIPLLYGTVGEILTEKSGSMNLGVEGIMAIGAIFGYLAGCAADSIAVGILVAAASAGLCGLLFAWLTVSLQANQNVTGLTMTTFGLGLYFFVGKGLGSNWPVLQKCENILRVFNAEGIPGLRDIPVAGKVLFSHNLLVYLGVIIAALVWVYMNKTSTGLKMRAIGENPGAADAAGINITLYKYLHVIAGAAIMGIGGYYMGLNLGGSFEGSNCWINGYGWIAIALVIFANWNPLLAIFGTFVFGFFNTLQIYNSSLAYAFPDTLGFLASVPPQLLKALPFIITAAVLIVDSIRRRRNKAEPAAVGVNYYREDR